jgi:hypothetical protein
VAAEEDSAEEVFTGVVLEVEVSTPVDLEAEVSVGEVSVVGSTAAAFVVALWLPDMLAAESAAAAAESALADRTFQIAFRPSHVRRECERSCSTAGASIGNAEHSLVANGIADCASCGYYRWQIC